MFAFPPATLYGVTTTPARETWYGRTVSVPVAVIVGRNATRAFSTAAFASTISSSAILARSFRASASWTASARRSGPSLGGGGFAACACAATRPNDATAPSTAFTAETGPRHGGRELIEAPLLFEATILSGARPKDERGVL